MTINYTYLIDNYLSLKTTKKKKVYPFFTDQNFDHSNS